MLRNYFKIINDQPQHSRAEQIKNHFNKLWTDNPEQFDPARNSMERERIERTWFLIQKHCNLPHSRTVDLGCGTGLISLQLQAAGANPCAVDVSAIPLGLLAHRQDPRAAHPIETLQSCLPSTILGDNSFDLVLCTDVIAFLDRKEYRLLLSELCRLVKPDGVVICSTPLDIDTEDPLNDFAALVDTEFTVDGWILSYHYLYIRLRRFFNAPASYWKSYCSSAYLTEQLALRSRWKGLFYKLNTFAFPAIIWRGISCLLAPFNHLLEQRRWVLLCLEKLSHFLYKEKAVSHAIFVGRRKPLEMASSDDSSWNPPLRKERKWE